MVLLPNHTYERTPAIRCPECTFDLITRTKSGLTYLYDVMYLGMFAQGLRKGFPLLGAKAKRAEEPRFACAVAMGWVEQIRCNLLAFH